MAAEARTGTFRIALPDGTPLFRHAVARVRSSLGEFTSDAGCRMPDAGSAILEFPAGPGLGAELTWEPGAPPVVGRVKIRVRNTAKKPVTIYSLEPLVGEMDGRAIPRDARILTLGFNLLGSSILAPNRLPSTGSGQGPVRSWWVTALSDSKGSRGIVIGAMSFKRSLPYFELSIRDADPAALNPELRIPNSELRIRAASDFRPVDFFGRFGGGGAVLGPGETMASEPIVILAGANTLDLLETYAEMVARENRFPEPPDPPAGYCDWYTVYGGTSEEFVLRMADVLREEVGDPYYKVNLFQIDDGWQIGGRNFAAGNSKFPHGMVWLAEQLHRRGLKAGIWAIPFNVSEDAPVFRDHPDWFVHADDGSPVRQPWVEYCLDVTNPAVVGWAGDQFHRISQDWGYDLVKIDGPTGALVAGHRAERRMPETVVEGFRRGLRALREGAGAGKFFLGCAPIGPQAGLVDSSRLGMDLNVGTGPGWGAVARNAQEVALKFFQHRRWWLNDPDMVMIRGPLTLDQARAAATVASLTGGPVLFGDPLDQLPPERLQILKFIVPPYPAGARPIDLFAEERLPTGDAVPVPRPENAREGQADNPPRVYMVPVDKPFGKWWLVAVFNWYEDAPVNIPLKLKDLGLDPRGSYLAYDRWEDRFLGEVGTGLKPAPPLDVHLAPASVRVIALHRRLPVPQVIATSLHLTGGALDLRTVHWDGARNRLSGESRGPAGAPYRIAIHVPQGFRAISRVVLEPSPGCIEVERTFPPSGRLRWHVDFAPAR